MNKKESLQKKFITNGFIASFSSKEPSIFNVRCGVYDCLGNHIELSNQIGGRGCSPRSIGEDKIMPELYSNITRIKKAFYIGVFVEQWGHFLIDVINRMYDLPDDKEILFVYSGKNKISGNYAELLKYIGITEDNLYYLQEGNIVAAESIILHEESFVPGMYYSSKYIELINTIVSNVHVNNVYVNKSVYFSRLQFDNAKKKEVGEKIIQSQFENNEWLILNPENMSVAEQISCFQKAKEIVMISGTIAHNIIFALGRHNGEFTILEKTSMENFSQKIIDEMLNDNIKINHIPIYDEKKFKNPISYGEGPFRYTMTPEFRKYLKEKSMNEIIYSSRDYTKDNIEYYYKRIMIKLIILLKRIYHNRLIHKFLSPIVIHYKTKKK